MTRDELLTALGNDMGYVRKYREKEKVYDHLDSIETRMARDQKSSIVKWLLLIGLPIGLIVLNANNILKDPNTLGGDILGGVVLALIISFVLKRKADKEYKDKLTLLASELDQLEDTYYQNSQLPEVSQGIHKAERFYYYVSNYIADDLKECAKLYYQEEQNKKLIDSMEEVAESVWDSNSVLADEISDLNTTFESVNRSVESVNKNIDKVKWNTTKF